MWSLVIAVLPVPNLIIIQPASSLPRPGVIFHDSIIRQYVFDSGRQAALYFFKLMFEAIDS